MSDMVNDRSAVEDALSDMTYARFMMATATERAEEDRWAGECEEAHGRVVDLFAALAAENDRLRDALNTITYDHGAGFDERDITAAGIPFGAWEQGFNDCTRVIAARARAALTTPDTPAPRGTPEAR